MAFAFSACSVASRFHASHAILAWFHDSSHDDNLLRNDRISSVSRCISRLEPPPPPPPPMLPLPLKASGEVREGDWNFGEDIISNRFSGWWDCDCDLGLRTKLARDPDYVKRKRSWVNIREIVVTFYPHKIFLSIVRNAVVVRTNKVLKKEKRTQRLSCCKICCLESLNRSWKTNKRIF